MAGGRILMAGGAAVAAAAALLFGRRWFRRDREERPAAALSRGKTEPGAAGQSGSARSAGPEAMRDPPAEWDEVDQAVDESFPASDPPPVGSKID
ncbi:MAG: hypothetical protein ACT4OE_03265 [Sphingosinicella sp.]